MEWRGFYELLTKNPKRNFKFGFCMRKNVEFSKTHYDSGFKYVPFWIHEKQLRIARGVMKRV